MNTVNDHVYVIYTVIGVIYVSVATFLVGQNINKGVSLNFPAYHTPDLK